MFLFDRGRTASQQEGSKALEAMAIVIGEVLPRHNVENIQIDANLRVHKTHLHWLQSPAKIMIFLVKCSDCNEWRAIKGVLRQTIITSCTTVMREQYFSFEHPRSKYNPGLRLPVAKVIKEQTRDCSGALKYIGCDCDNELCKFARDWDKQTAELFARNSVEERNRIKKYGGPGHM